MADKISWSNETRKLSELEPWARNPRQINKRQAERLVESFDRFGQVETIAVGPHNEVYNGHQRLNVLKEKYGDDYEVAVRVASRALTEKEREKLTVFLHKGAAGDWDFDMLANEFELDDLLEWGFEPKELDLDLWAPEPPEDVEPQIDKAEELREKWGVESGQLWKLGEHRLICGDCTDKAVVDRVMGGENAEMCFTSPPYNVAKNSSLPNKYKYLDNSDDRIEGDYLFLLSEFTALSIAVSEYVFVNIQSISGNKTALIDYLFSFRDVYADTIIWDKMVAEPAMAKNVLNSRFEYIHVFSEKASRSIGTKEFRGTIDNVLTINSRQDKKLSNIHKATFPTEFAEWFIDNFTNSGETVYEPFLGSGTTLIACERLGRKCRAVEISPAYVAVAIQRWVDVTGGVPELITNDS